MRSELARALQQVGAASAGWEGQGQGRPGGSGRGFRLVVLHLCIQGMFGI